MQGDTVVLAHPFATGPFGFSVMGPRTLWWGGCAWDAFAIPNLVPGSPSVLVLRARRREPAEATDYFRSVGLSGPFWGLPQTS